MKFFLMLLLLLTVSAEAVASDKLVILSPHRKTIQAEFVPVFRDYYKKTFATDVEVEWIDQGGTSNAVKFLQGKNGTNPNDVGVDLFWGGPSSNFIDMASMNLLAPYALSKEARAFLPKECAGVPLSDPNNLWHASTISSFGIMFNKPVLKLEKLAEPTLWSDLGKREFFDNVILADPRNSGTNSTMMFIVLESLGWDKGWGLLTSIVGNARRVTQSSSDPIQAVVAGDAAAAMVVDFYGLSQIWELGRDKIGFTLPAGQTVLDPDAVALVKGAKNIVPAQRFIDFLLTDQAQKLWILPKGFEDGPKTSNLARLAVSPNTYLATAGKHLDVLNPFEVKKYMTLDSNKAAKIRQVMNDYSGAVLIDAHKDLKAAVKTIRDKNLPEAASVWLGKPLLSEKDMLGLAGQWENEIFRNKMINEWSAAARKKYLEVTAGKSPWAAH